MSQQFDIFDNLNSYLNQSDNSTGLSDDGGESLRVEDYSKAEPECKILGKKKARKISQSSEDIVAPAKKCSPEKQQSKVPEDGIDVSGASSTNLLQGLDNSELCPIETIELNDDLDHQLKEMQKQYDLIFNKDKSVAASNRSFFGDLKRRYQALLRQHKKPARRSTRRRDSFADNFKELQEIFYDICINYGLMAPPAAVSAQPRRRTRRSRQLEVINLIDNPGPGIVCIDSDEEEAPPVNISGNLSFDSENYEISVKVKWQDSIQRITLRKYQQFSDLITHLADKFNADPSCVILDINERIIRPNDTPDSIDYKIHQFISGRVVDRALAHKLMGEQLQEPQSSSQNLITLRVQSDRWKKPLSVSIHPTQKMRVAVIKCAEELKCEPDTIKLKFDGEPLELDATPQDLDLEGGEILDLRFIK